MWGNSVKRMLNLNFVVQRKKYNIEHWKKELEMKYLFRRVIFLFSFVDLLYYQFVEQVLKKELTPLIWKTSPSSQELFLVLRDQNQYFILTWNIQASTKQGVNDQPTKTIMKSPHSWMSHNYFQLCALVFREEICENK